MSTEENRKLVQSVLEAANRHDLEGTVAWEAPTTLANGQLTSREANRKHQAELFAAFPDLKWTVHDMVAQGDQVWIRYSFSGTHKAEFEDIPPTGKVITFAGICVYRIADGVLVEYWDALDELGFYRQLGHIPA